MQPKANSTWQTPVLYFVLFNLLAVPVTGRVIWFVMLQMNNEHFRLASVLLSVACAVGILAVNVLLTRWAIREALPKRGRTILWAITGVTFLVPLGFGVFSPIDLAIAVVRGAIW